MRATDQLGLQSGSSDTDSPGPINAGDEFRQAESNVRDAFGGENEKDKLLLENILGVPLEKLQEAALDRSLAASTRSAEGEIFAQISYEPYTLAVQAASLEISEDLGRVHQIVNDICKMSQLQPNFDGEGGPVISQSNIDAACTLVLTLHSAYGLVCNHASPTHEGGVEIESDCRYWEMALVVNDPQRIEYLIKTSRGRTSGTAPLPSLPEVLWDQLG